MIYEIKCCKVHKIGFRGSKKIKEESGDIVSTVKAQSAQKRHSKQAVETQ